MRNIVYHLQKKPYFAVLESCFMKVKGNRIKNAKKMRISKYIY